MHYSGILQSIRSAEDVRPGEAHRPPMRIGSPGEIIAKLNQELVAVMRMPDVEEQLRRQGIEPMTSTPEEFAAFLRSDIRKWGELVRRTGAHVD